MNTKESLSHTSLRLSATGSLLDLLSILFVLVTAFTIRHESAITHCQSKQKSPLLYRFPGSPRRWQKSTNLRQTQTWHAEFLGEQTFAMSTLTSTEH